MPDHNHHAHRRARPLRACLVAVPLATMAILAAGCSSGSSGSAADPGSTSASSTLTEALKYTDCMRSHGIADFPDPNSQGQINITMTGPNSDLAPTNPKFVAAQAACQSLQPAEGTPAQEQQGYAADLRYAHCMQQRGIAVPDPRSPGSGPVSQSQSNSSTGNGDQGTYGNGVSNPNSPQFIAANRACQHYLPAGQGPALSTLNNGGGGA